MSGWRGLHNRDKHEPVWAVTGSADCFQGDCGECCYPNQPCRCCLAAEVERLTAELTEARAAKQTATEAGAEALAERDRRIAAALARCEEAAGDHPDRDIAADYSPLLARDVLVILRGES